MAIIIFNKDKYRRGQPVELIFGERTPEDNIDFVFDELGYPSPGEIEFVFGGDEDQIPAIRGEGVALVELTSEGYAISDGTARFGNSNVIVPVTSSGDALLPISGRSDIQIAIDSLGGGIVLSDREGNSNLVVSVTSTGTGTKETGGFSDVEIPLYSFGTGISFGGVPIYGDSNTTIDVTSSGFGFRGLWAFSDVIVPISSTGAGYRQLNGNSNQSIGLTSVGVSVLTGGFDIDGSQASTINVMSQGVARFLYPTFGSSSYIVQVSSRGEGTVRYDMEDISGYGESTVFIAAPGAGHNLPDQPPVYSLPDQKIDYSPIRWLAKLYIDQETGEYEIREISTNRLHLENIYPERQTQLLELGDYLKSEADYEDETIYGVDISRKFEVRKYGASSIDFEVNINEKYEFFKNSISIENLIKRIVDRGVLDIQSLYEVEYE